MTPDPRPHRRQAPRSEDNRESREEGRGGGDKTPLTTIDSERVGITLAAAVRGLMEGLAWSRCRALIRTGRVQINDLACFEDARRMTLDERVTVFPEAKKRRGPTLEDERIIHFDHDVVVVNKPAGLISVPFDERDRDSLLSRVREAIRRRGARTHGGDKKEGLGVVQRLDKDTTGLLVFARTRKARKHLEAQFRAHSVSRRYLAIANGVVRPGTHQSHLVADRGDGLRGSWKGSHGAPPKNARHAITHVHIEGQFEDATLLACMLETGRQHQIRIHLAETGHPLVGERIYVRGYRGRPIAAPRPMLHAASLGFNHPANERPLTFEAPLPPDFLAALEALRS